jgi:putative ABC transport system permease protein
MPEDQKLAFAGSPGVLRWAGLWPSATAGNWETPLSSRNIYPGNGIIIQAIYTGAEATTDDSGFCIGIFKRNPEKECRMPGDTVGWCVIKVARPELAAPQVASQIDALFKNSLAETLTKRKKLFLGFVSMTSAILMAIQVVSWVVIGVILVVLANTMAMSARERLGEYAVLKTIGFRLGTLQSYLR